MLQMFNSWDAFQNSFYRIIATLAVLTNTVMIYLILYHSPKTFGAYKYLMISICLFEALYALLDLAASPVVYTEGSMFLIVISEDRSVFPVSMLFGIDVIYCSCFGVSLAIFAIHFVYRHLVLSGYEKLTGKSMRSIVFWQIIPLPFGVLWGLNSWYFRSHGDSLDKMIKVRYGLDIEKVAYVCSWLYPIDENGRESINWNTIYGVIGLVILISASIFTMAFFGIKSYLKINSAVTKSQRSAKYKALQSQLILALLVQSVIPLTLMHFSTGIVFLLPFFMRTNELFGRVLTISVSIYPVFDPLPNMLIIKEYRRAILGKVNCSKRFK